MRDLTAELLDLDLLLLIFDIVQFTELSVKQIILLLPFENLPVLLGHGCLQRLDYFIFVNQISERALGLVGITRER